MELRRYWKIICRRRWIIIITFSVFFLTVVIGTNLVAPIYEANAKILVESSDTLTSLMSSLGLAVPGGKSASDGTYDTDIALATIRPLTEELISKLNLKDRDGEPLEPETLVKYSILNNLFPRPYLEVVQYEESDILEIVSNSTDPKEVANMSNDLAELYINDTLEQARKEYKAAREFLEIKIKDVKKQYYNALLEKKNFMLNEATVDLEVETHDLLTYIQALKNDRKNTEIEISAAEESILLIEEKIKGKKYVSNDLVDYIETKLSDLLAQVSAKSIDITEEHPDILQLNIQINTLNEYLKDRAGIVINETEVSIAPIYEELIRGLKDAYINKKITEIKRDLINRFIEKSQDELMKIPLKNIKQSKIDLSVSVNQDVYRKLLEYLTQVSIAESMTLSNIRIVEPAVEADIEKPYFPSKKLNYVLGIFMGTFWGIFIAFFIEYIDHSIKDQQDLQNYNFTLLGSIPSFKGDPLISNIDTNDPMYEAYRKVLHSMQFAGLDKDFKKILVSGISPKDGSSTIIVNLGIAAAREGKRVLLVDADLRRPNIHNIFSLNNSSGLTDVLLEKAEMKNIIQESGVEGLRILVAGSVPSDTGLLLKSSRMRDIIRVMEGAYDFLLFNTAPMLIKNDAIVLMEKLDGMAIVSRCKVTTHDALLKTTELLKNANISPIGIILNDVSAS